MTGQATHIIGHDALQLAEQRDVALSKYADPTEGAHTGLTRRNETMWTITDQQSNETTIAALKSQYPDLVAIDESGFEVDIDDIGADPTGLAEAGYFGPEGRRILFWETERASENDDGTHAVASAVWEAPPPSCDNENAS